MSVRPYDRHIEELKSFVLVRQNLHSPNYPKKLGSLNI